MFRVTIILIKTLTYSAYSVMRRQNLSMSFAEIFQAGREARELG